MTPPAPERSAFRQPRRSFKARAPGERRRLRSPSSMRPAAPARPPPRPAMGSCATKGELSACDHVPRSPGGAQGETEAGRGSLEKRGQRERGEGASGQRPGTLTHSGKKNVSLHVPPRSTSASLQLKRMTESKEELGS